MAASVEKLAVFLLLHMIVPSCATAQSMPSDLVGSYSHSGEEQCGSFSIERNRVLSEGMGCDVLSIKRLDGELGMASNFEIYLSCQMDDPQKPKLSGTFSLNKIFDKWVLGVRLDVEPKLRRKFSYPAIQTFGKCKAN